MLADDGERRLCAGRHDSTHATGTSCSMNSRIPTRSSGRSCRRGWQPAWGEVGRLTVFLVGDPSNPSTVSAAPNRDFHDRRRLPSKAVFLPIPLPATSRGRNAPAIIAVVNALFSAEPAFMPFRESSGALQQTPGFVELLPLASRRSSPESAVADATTLRDPLTQAAGGQVDGRREQEASQLAERLRAMIGRMLIHDGEGGKTRLLVAGDVMLLVRSRTQIAVYERALAAAGIPYAAASRGGLLESLKCAISWRCSNFLSLPRPTQRWPMHSNRRSSRAVMTISSRRRAARSDSGGSASTHWRKLTARVGICYYGTAARRTAARGVARPGADAAGARSARSHLRQQSHGPLPAGGTGSASRCSTRQLEALLLLALDVDGGATRACLHRRTSVLRRADDDDSRTRGELAADDSAAADGRAASSRFTVRRA